MQRTTDPEPLEASYTPIDLDNLRLRPRSSSSYDTNDLASLAAFLLRQRYTPVDVRSRLEYARGRKGARLVIAYHSGAVVLQGDDVAGARAELQRFVVDGGAA